MEDEIYGILMERKLIMVTAALLTGAFVFLLCHFRPGGILLSAVEGFPGMLKEKGRRTDWYRKCESRLKKSGAAYHFWKGISPTGYLMLRLILGSTGFVAGAAAGTGYGLCLMAGLFFLPELLLEHLNKKDNERMLPDIKMIYNTLAVQIRAGIYLTDALAECYRNIRERRLKDAFMELAGDIVMKSDIFSSLEKLQSKFHNRYIDSLCVTILQALESGQAVEALNDIGEQLKDMENAILERRKDALDRSMTFYQLGILAAELMIVIYACVRFLFETAKNF